MKYQLQRLVIFIGVVFLFYCILLFTNSINAPRIVFKQQHKISSFEGFNNETGAGKLIVPNIVHFIRFNKPNFSFVDAVIVLAAFKNQNPDKIMFHANDVNFIGPHWDKIKSTPGLVYEIVKTAIPDDIFGQKFNEGWKLWHAGDVTRIRILMKYGGIFLDNDSYIVKSLDRFRKYEIAIGWDENQCIGTQVIVANKDARFLPLWLESYRVYHADKWYYNAGCKPTEEILYKTPELVHRVKLLFGVHMLVHNLYKSYWKDWRKQYAIHLLINHRSYLDEEHLDKWPVFTEKNIVYYNYTFGTMAREAYGISQNR
ncbi:hypothetical protein L9F63_018771 [Diploptera punctata]|uniref:Uncharacterized protein n=1 Tax=Diploptera punctata TaxID=6984 RepID=A0AAD8EEX1_DIPPU|nr:hypothetical protein L9F63_018771 [Diploptera punctata]